MKNKRQEALAEIVSAYEVDTQAELIDRLRERGFEVTQATISRDIRELKLVKVAGAGGKYKYALPHHEQTNISAKFRNLLVETVTGIDSANNIAVVKTCSGMAQGAALAIDSMGRDDIVGSVAGDDTIIIVMRSDDAAANLIAELREICEKRV